MSEPRLRDLVGRIAELDPPLFLFGGVAEDIVLDGRLTRPHVDVDVLVVRSELADRIAQCAQIGFHNLMSFYEPQPGKPLVVGEIQDGARLELGIVEDDGDGLSFVTGGEHGLFSVRLSDGVFDFPPQRFEDTAVRTISPTALYQIRAGLAVVHTFSDRGTKDTLAQESLRQAFFGDAAPDDLEPAIAPL